MAGTTIMDHVRWPRQLSLLYDDCIDCFTHVSDPWHREFKRTKEDEKYEDGEVLKGFECLENSFKSFHSAAAPSTCPKTCQVCYSQFRPLDWQKRIHILRYTKTVSDSDATKQIAVSRNQTKADYAAVRQIIEQYGDTLIKRWTKKPILKRMSILLSIMPEAYLRTSDMVSLNEMSCKNRRKFRKRLLLPWLNLEYLSKDPTRLLKLVQNRASTSPSSWVMFDNHQLDGSFGQGALEVSYNPHCIVLGGGDAEEFGTLTSWSEDRAHRWEIIGFPKAQLILEAQELLSTYLRGIVSAILENGLSSATKGDSTWKLLAAADCRSEDDEYFKQRCVVGFDQPPALCLQKMSDSFHARYAAAKDEAWFVQTDPAFARDTLTSAESSTVHKIVSRTSQGHLQSKTLTKWQGCEKVRSSVLVGMMTDGIARLRMMKEVSEQVRITLQSHEEHQEQISDGKHADEFLDALRMLDCVLVATFLKLMAKGKRLTLHLGVFDAHFDHGVCGCEIPLATKKSKADPVFRAMNALASHNEEDQDLPSNALNILQRHHDRFPPALQECISDMVAVDEAIMSLRCFRPSFGPAMRTLSISGSQGKAQYYSFHADENLYKHRLRLFESLKRFMSCPMIEVRVSPKSLVDFDASHKALGAFWEEYRQIRLELLVEKKCPEELTADAMESAKYGLTQEYKDSMAHDRLQLQDAIAEKEAQKKKTSTPKKHSMLVHATSTTPYQKTWGTESSNPSPKSLKSKEQPKEKVKTKGLPSEPSSSNENPAQNATEPENDTENTSERITVSSDTMDIIHRMFVSYGKHRQSSVRWNVFVAAMEDAGLAAANDKGGSEVTFRDIKRGKCTVVFHAPHPDPRINPICMRAYGKRLQRNMGWSYELFVERE